ncbi:hypothetical protein [Erythrobacter sp. JK5]|uniref:hypothetical protein n=1 Tax=Erythrobacter sp. JK5 TaxID=2829500 RepID=UPI001BA754C5|nr:hypothetical protein [Erythrobacter sp. JK5]QUL37962.1 hypothetical protein KDC96_00550 [Erythrobacter sp. JK5]
MSKAKLTFSDAVKLVNTDERLARAIIRQPSLIRDLIDADEPERDTERLGMSDAMRIASKNETFAKALMKDPERFRGTFNFSDAEIGAILTIPGKADLANSFSYDA